MELELLISKLKEGDERAFSELIRRFARRLMSAAKLYTNSIEDAEDVLQDTFIIIFKKIKDFQGHEEKFFYSWMKTIAIRKALSHKRKKYVSMEKSLEHDFDIGKNSEVLDKLSAEEIMQHVFDLPQGFRQVFGLYAIEGYSHKEIAEQLNIKETTSRTQYMRARTILKNKVGNFRKAQVI